MNIYRVVRVDGSPIRHHGRGSDPFTNKSAAQGRCTQLNNEAYKFYNATEDWYKVQVAYVEWEDYRAG